MKKTLVLCSKFWIEIMKYQICMLKLPLENETLKEVFCLAVNHAKRFLS